MIPRVAILVVLSLACTRAGEQHMPPATVAGHYGPGGFVADLNLLADGRYQYLVLAGLTDDGCGTFQGTGFSSGHWALEGKQIRFEPTNESSELIVRLSEADVGIQSNGSLRIKTPRHEFALQRKVD